MSKSEMRWHKVVTDGKGREWDVFAVPRMKNVCLVCEKPIAQPERAGRARIYCSQDCAHAAAGARKLIERRGGVVVSETA